MPYVVYLAGTMTGKHEHFDWRIHAEREFRKVGIHTLSPFRGKSITQLDATGNIEFSDYSKLTEGISPNRIVARDYADVRKADILLANLTETKDIRPSIGTISELAWAYAMQKPVICIVDNTTNENYYKHPFTRVFVHHWVDSIEAGIDAVIHYWSPVAD